MSVSQTEWSKKEKELVHRVFNTAYERESNALIAEVKLKANGILELQDLWSLHDFLSARRHHIDGKYDDRDTGLIFAFATLVKEGWLSLEELNGLEADKLTKVAVLARLE